MYKLSIVTINYNNALGLKKTIESVVKQSCNEIEFVIIDGGSTDGSVEIIQQYQKDISYWVSEKDKGIYNALNKGIRKATGEYILFLNSGDYFYKDDSLNNVMNQLDFADIIACDINTKNAKIDIVKKHPDSISFDYLYTDTLAHQSTFIKRELFDKVGLYDEDYIIVSDWKFFIEALTFYKATYKAVHTILSVYNLDGLSATAKGTNIRKQERRTILKNDFSFFVKDYENLQILKQNRFKMLLKIEQTKFGKKFVSVLFRIYIKLFNIK